MVVTFTVAVRCARKALTDEHLRLSIWMSWAMGENNTKNGNRFLAWAYVEAANYAARFYPEAQAFVQRKTARANRTLAIKALGHKLARASYYVMRDQVEFDPARLFG